MKDIQIDSNMFNVYAKDFFFYIRCTASRCYIEVYDKDTEQRVGVFEVCQIEK